MFMLEFLSDSDSTTSIIHSINLSFFLTIKQILLVKFLHINSVVWSCHIINIIRKK